MRSTVSVSSAATVYCFPPVRITAIMTTPEFWAQRGANK
jgi:hypothetical protein